MHKLPASISLSFTGFAVEHFVQLIEQRDRAPTLGRIDSAVRLNS
jgi:hypothetical protein